MDLSPWKAEDVGERFRAIGSVALDLANDEGKNGGDGEGRGGGGEEVVFPLSGVYWCCLVALWRGRGLCFVDLSVELMSECVLCIEKMVARPICEEMREKVEWLQPEASLPEDDVSAVGELFPMVHWGPPPPTYRGRSRRGKQRGHRRKRVWEWGRQLIKTLNEWFAAGVQSVTSLTRRRRRRRSRVLRNPNHPQQSILQRLKLRVELFCRRFDGGTKDDLNTELKDDCFYGQRHVGGKTIPLTVDNVAIPGEGGRKVRLIDLLPAVVVEELKSVRLVEGAESEEASESADDDYASLLFGVSPGEYEPLVFLLQKHGIVELVSTPGEAVQGVFGVPKGDLARLILNAVAANLLCKTPPDPDLPLIESLAKLVVTGGDRLFLSLLDLSDYYHGLLLPEDLKSLFGLPPVWVDGKQFFPRWVTLPMGFSWAVYLAQKAHVHVLESKSERFRSSLKLSGPAVPRFVDKDSDVVGIYIDDVITLSTTVERSVSFLQHLRGHEVMEVREKKVVLACLDAAVQAWGVELSEAGVFQPPQDKLGRLILDTRRVLSLERIYPRQLQSLTGKWLWFCLLVRSTLSTMTPLFRQGRSLKKRIYLWPSSRACLESLIAISPLLCVNPSRPVGALVATDASSTGGGVVVCSDYSAEGLRQWAPYCYHKGRGDLESSEYREGVGALVEKFKFETGFGWKWRRLKEHITLKEGRAFWVGYQRVVLHSKMPWDARHTFLEDNLGVVGAVTKGRSTSPLLNNLIKRMAALQLLTGSTVDLIWCPTLYQPADGVSRSS